MVLCQKLDVACLKLHDCISEYLGLFENEKVEWSTYITILSWIPFESDYSELKSIHSETIVFKLLVSIFNLIETINLIFKTNV